jgi:hypothetical protein
MELAEAIESLKKLPPEKQAAIIRAIEDETATSAKQSADKTAGVAAEDLPQFLRGAVAHIQHMGSEVSSENPSEFAGR